MAAEFERSAFEFSLVSKRGESRHLQALTASGITGGVFLFSLGVFCGCWFPVSGKCINSLETGHRVWTEAGLCDHGHEKVNVPAKTGGTIEPFPSYSGGLNAVRWDTGQRSVHYDNELFVIGNARSLTEFEEAIMAEAIRVSRILGPQGGNRQFMILLRNGDWVSGISYCYLLPRLEAANVPIQIEQLARNPSSKKRRIASGQFGNRHPNETEPCSTEVDGIPTKIL